MMATLSQGVLNWQGRTIPRMVQAMWETNDYYSLPALADALDDAGCLDAGLVASCRQFRLDVPSGFKVLVQIPDTPPVPNISWRPAYQALGMEAQFDAEISKLKITECLGFWTPPMIKGLTHNKIVAGFRQEGVQVYTYRDNLDAAVTVNDRDPNRDGSYVIRFKATVEPEEENKNQSADYRRQQKCQDGTLLENLFLMWGYWLTTKIHLNIKNWVHCAGSRDSGGGVPSVDWHPGDRGVWVGWYYPGNRRDDLRARSAVSLPTEASGAQPE